MRGARAVRESFVAGPAGKHLRTVVVWIPMLDDDERPAAVEQAAHLAGTPQFWDGGQLFGAELGRALGGNAGWIAWDIYLFYAPGAPLDAPTAALAQAGGVVIGTPGLLPALPDQSALKPKFRGRAVVVGEQAHLGTLLREAAASFARRRSAAGTGASQ